MFSSSWHPKTLLANYLATSLAELFDVDPNEIESDLLTNAYIKLQKIRVHPYILDVPGDPIVCQGWVDSIEFRWKWGTGFGDGAHAYIQNTQVAIEGIKLHIYQTNDPPSGAHRVADLNAAPQSTTTTTTTTDPDWKARYLQQIVDHLRLSTGSLEISIDLYGYRSVPSRLRVLMKNAELVTLGGEAQSQTRESGATAGLRQRLSLGSLSAHIDEFSDTGVAVTYPLLDPVGYRAMVTRVSGRRFVDGIGAGLVISGEKYAMESDLQIHAGMHQVSCLLQLQKMFGFEDTTGDKEQETETQASTTDTDRKSTLFILPVSKISIVLQNEANLRLDDCLITLRTDGSSCCVETGGALYLDGCLLNHTTAGAWNIDFLHSDISVRSQISTDAGSEETVAKLELHVDQCRTIYDGLFALLPLFEETGNETKSIPWHFHIEGFAEVALVSSSDKRGSMKLLNPSLLYLGSNPTDHGHNLPGLPVVCTWDSIQMQSVDLGSLFVFVPKVDSSTDGQVMSFADSAVLTLGSLDDIKSVSDFAGEFIGIMGVEEGESTGIPLYVSLSKCVVSVADENVHLELSDVVAHGNELYIQVASGTSDSGSFTVEGLKAGISSFDMTIENISSASLVGVASLDKSVSNLKLKWIKNVDSAEEVFVQTNGVAFLLTKTAANRSGKSTSMSLFDFKLPIGVDGVELKIDGLVELRQEQITGPLAVIDSFHAKLQPVSSLNHSATAVKADVAWKSLQYRECHVSEGSIRATLEASRLDVSMSARGLVWMATEHSNCSAKVGSVDCQALLCPLDSATSDLPGYHVEALNACLMKAALKVRDSSELCIPDTGMLVSPVQSLDIAFSDRKIDIGVSEIHWQQPVEEKEQTNDVDATGLVDLLRYPIEIRIAKFQLDSELSSRIEPTFGLKSLHLRIMAVDLATLQVPFALQSCHEVWYLQDLIQVPSIEADGTIDLENVRLLHELDVKLSRMHLYADLSTMKWSDLLKQKAETSTTILLPYTKIGSFDVHLKSKGKLLGVEGATLNCNSFSGDENSTSETVAKHYVSVFKKRIPYLLTNVNIGGANVGDSIGMTVAQTALSSSIGGAVVGIGVRDGVGGAISLGKQTRGATESERYHFGDVSRGVLAATRFSAKKPAAAASITADYTSRNRERLGGAAGSGAAMMAGAAIAGPIGLVAGAVVGSLAGKKAVKATFGEYKGDRNKDLRQNEEKEVISPKVIAASNGGYIRPDPIVPSQAMENTCDFFADVPQATGYVPPQGGTVSNTEAIDDPFSVFETRVQRVTPPTHDSTLPSDDDPLAMFTVQQEASQAAIQHEVPQHHSTSAPYSSNQGSRQSQQGYKFGDVTRGILAKGKEKRGGEGSSYKFGDFTRGLFK